MVRCRAFSADHSSFATTLNSKNRLNWILAFPGIITHMLHFTIMASSAVQPQRTKRLPSRTNYQ